MDAETFCDRWHGLDLLSPEDREEVKSERGYRAKCVRLLSAVLRKTEKTVSNWGAKFENMPPDHEATLAYADAIRGQLNSAPGDLLQLYLEQQRKEN